MAHLKERDSEYGSFSFRENMGRNSSGEHDSSNVNKKSLFVIKIMVVGNVLVTRTDLRFDCFHGSSVPVNSHVIQTLDILYIVNHSSSTMFVLCL